MLNYESEVITKHISELQNALSLLHGLRSRDFKVFKKDQRNGPFSQSTGSYILGNRSGDALPNIPGKLR